MLRFFLSLVAAIGIVASAVNACAAPRIVKFAIFHMEGMPSHIAALDLKKFVEEKTDGEYRVDLYPSGKLGNSITVFQGVQMGTIDLAFDTTSNWASFAPILGVFDLAYIFPDNDTATAVLSGKIGKDLLEKVGQAGKVRAFGFMGSGFRNLITTRPVLKLEDAANMKIRSTPSRWHVAALQSLGFNPTPMVWAETITGLQQKLVDGVDMEAFSVIDFKMNEVTSDWLYTNHIYTTYMLIGNVRWWNSLPENVRLIFDEAIQRFVEQCAMLQIQKVTDSESRLESAGYRVHSMSDEEKARWVKASESVIATLPADMKEIVEAIKAESGK